MILEPSQVADLSEDLRRAHSSKARISEVRMQRLNRLLEHNPADMVATAEAGITLSAFQKEIAKSGQWLPLDPPGPEHLTLNQVLGWDFSGPRRFGFGSVREHVIGMEVVLADGRLIKSGGKVVKNVAGYDLCKLFIGAKNTLGIIVRCTFKLWPIPEKQAFFTRSFSTVSEVSDILSQVLNAPISPMVLDVSTVNGMTGPYDLWVGFSGVSEDVTWQAGHVEKLGFQSAAETAFLARLPFRDAWEATRHTTSVLPSRLMEVLSKLEGPLVARAGNGIIYHQAGSGEKPVLEAGPLVRDIQLAYDPHEILSQLAS